MSKIARRLKKRRAAKKNPSTPRHNPPLFTDMLMEALPGLGGFIGTRALTKFGIAAVEKKWPSKSKHVGAGVSLATFLAMWFLGHRVKFLEKYHTPITVGSGIAAAINLVQIYLPKIGWLFGDPTKATAGTPAQVAAPQQNMLPANLEEIDDDPAWYTNNDAYDAGRYAGNAETKYQAPRTSTPEGQQALLNELDDEGMGGVFAGGLAS